MKITTIMNYNDFYQSSLKNPIAFWTEQAKNIDWYEFPTKVLSKDREGLYRWYKGGMLNTCHLALDYHVQNGRGNQTAIQYDSPVTQTTRRVTYKELLTDTSKFAGALTNLGVKKGDRVLIYMPMIPDVVVAMLACARIGAIHSVVFGGFAAHEVAMRIDDAKPKLIITASAGVEFERVIPYQHIIEKAIQEAEYKVKKVVISQRNFHQWEMKPKRDHNFAEIQKQAEPVAPVPVRATDPLYILYTSGTTGKPKGIVRDNGGHAVALKFSLTNIYGIKPGEVFWAGSDVGWVVGHSYIVYGPLIQGCTTILFEGKPVRTPDAGAYWRVIQDYKVNVFFTAPTGFRAVKKEDPHGKLKQNYDISSLRTLFLAGERCDIATLNWAKDLLNVPVIDHWWQTESGWPMIANPAGIGLFEVKPGSAGKCVPGFDIRILDESSHELPDGTEGAVAIKLPLPPGCLPNLWNNTERFKAGYLEAFPGYYFSGDGGFRDKDGYIFITGRIDDVINVAGHRLSTAEMEEIVATHPAVAECAVIGVEEELKGQIPVGFVVTKAGCTLSEEALEKELAAMVRDKIGAVACYKRSLLVARLPKTRSGKILRKIMRHIADGKQYAVPGTIEDITVLDELKVVMKEKGVGK